MILGQLVEMYCQELRERQLAIRTVTEQRANLLEFVRLLASEAPSTAVTNEHLTVYLTWLKQFAITTQAERSRVVRRFLRWVRERGHLTQPLRSDWTIARERPQAWIPSSDQVSVLLKAPADSLLGRRDQVVLEILYGAGLRRSECSALNVQDWDRVLSGLWIRQSKGLKDRLQPVGEVLAAQIDQYLEKIRPLQGPAADETALLLTSTGRRLQHYSIAGIVCHYRRQLDLPKLTAHSLRRAFANHMLQNGAGVHHLQQLLSHQSPETTLRYVQTSLEELRVEHRRCHPRARKRRERDV